MIKFKQKGTDNPGNGKGSVLKAISYQEIRSSSDPRGPGGKNQKNSYS
jgi:hypothetical protein